MNCCENIKNLGCIYSCDVIQIGYNAPVSGVYIIELQPTRTKVVSTTNTIGTPLVFGSGLNEDAVSVFKIIKPDGTYYVSPNGEDCFQADVSPSTNPELSDVAVVPIGCDDATVTNSNATYSATVASGGTLTLANQTVNVFIDSVLAGTTTYPAMTNPTINIVWI